MFGWLSRFRKPAPVAAAPVPTSKPTIQAKVKVKPSLVAGTALAALCCTVITGFEGLRTKSYLDVVGIPTVCVGETKGIRMGMSFTKAQCQEMLLKRLVEDFAPAVERCARQPMGDDLYAAHLSLAYNIGTGAYCKSSVVRLWNQGDRRASCNAFLMWNKAGGRVIAGLTKRREAERALCLKGV